MKTQITYTTGFSIPKALPHAFDPEEDSSDIFGDSVEVVGGKLILQSKCGSTTFLQWEEEGNAFLIPATTARYEGAYCALNAVWGIDFPQFTLGGVDSSYGHFKTMAGYELARRAVTFARIADTNNASPAASAAMDGIADEHGNPL